MGDEAAGTDERMPLSDNSTVGVPFITEKAESLAKRHGLETSAELEELLDHLVGLSCRDQEEGAFDPARMAARRKRGFDLAKAMQKQASTILHGLEQLHRDWNAFNETVNFRPALLEAIFDVDTGGPEVLFLPPEVTVLQSLFQSAFDGADDDSGENSPTMVDVDALAPYHPCPAGFWEAADRRLQAVADLPIRARLTKGPVPNDVVRAALAACRSYWIKTGNTWTMANLKMKEVRQDNVVSNLTGLCERFVADALSGACIAFNLPELHSAWEAVDAAERKAIQQVPSDRG